MTQKFSIESTPIFLIFAFFQAFLIFSAMSILLKPKFIIADREAFCLILSASAGILLLINLICAGIIIDHLLSKNPSKQTTTKKEKKSSHILLSFFQVFLGLAFSISGIALAFLVFFEKINDKKALLFAQIYCGILASAAISMIIFSVLSTIIGYFYSKNLIKNNVKFEDIKENKLLKTLNFFHNIANILASLNIYACHLFINEEKLQANKIYIDKDTIKFKVGVNNVYHFLSGEKCRVKGDKNEIINNCEIELPITKNLNLKAIIFYIKYKNQNYYIEISNIDFKKNNFENLNSDEVKDLIKKLFIETDSKNIKIYQYNNENYQNNEIIKDTKITFNSLGLFIPQLTLQIS